MSYMPCHQYQRDRCEKLRILPSGSGSLKMPAQGLSTCDGRPILNVACKEDPAHLGRDFSATNIDIEDFDIETGTDLYSLVPNFQRMSALQLTFEAETFFHVVLGEFLEHCTVEAATIAMKEAHRVLKPAGLLTVTFPRDSRQPEEQRPPHELQTYCEGITSWHQTIWTDEMLEKLASETGFRELVECREVLDYRICQCTGIGAVMEKLS